MKKNSQTKTTSTKTTTPKLKSKLASPMKKTVASLRKKQSPMISLQFSAPEAQEVYVAGTFNDWTPTATPLKKSAGGKWTAQLALQPGQYEYLFVVDDRWTVDPAAKQAVPNPFGGCNCLLEVA